MYHNLLYATEDWIFLVNHDGLYFTKQTVAFVRKNRNRKPLVEAWQRLDNVEQCDKLSQGIWNGLRYRFNDDIDAGQHTVEMLVDSQPASLDNDKPKTTRIAETLALAHAFEMVRDHVRWTEDKQAVWLADFANWIETLNQTWDTSTYTEKVWLSTLNAAAGVVLEDESLLHTAAQLYRQIIDQDIHPTGYIAQVVEDKNGYQQFVSVIHAMTLLAEIAKNAGIGLDLWNYNNRGVSIATAALYPLYYYYYPEKWLWSENLETEETTQVFKMHGGYLEMLNQHLNRRTTAIDLILDEIRPVFDTYGGGLVTLTHGVPERRGLFG